jgi:replicative DNA helicase
MKVPHDIELEKAILGAILLESESIYEATPIIKPESFYLEAHKIIYSVIYEHHQKSIPFDLLTLTNELRLRKKLEIVGGAYYISQLTSKVGSALHLVRHCQIIQELFIKRKFQKILIENFKKLESSDDVYDVFNCVNRETSSLFEFSTSINYHPIYEIMKDRMNEISKIKKTKEGLIGIHTGFSKLNSFTNGFQPGDYVIIGARPSMGKTIIALLVAKAAASISNIPVLFFSLEMSRKRLSDRLISVETEIDSKLISANKLDSDDWIKIDNSLQVYKSKNIFIIDDSNLTIEDIKSKALVLHRKFGIKMVIIDYIQLIKFSFREKNTNDNISHISRNIKTIAKDIDGVSVALSQLTRGDGIPRLSNLRDSGSLEQDADIVWLLHREDYEGRECDISARLRIDNIIAKNRNAEIGAFYTYRNRPWSYIGEIPFEEIESMRNEQMPFNDNYEIDFEQKDKTPF